LHAHGGLFDRVLFCQKVGLEVAPGMVARYEQVITTAPAGIKVSSLANAASFVSASSTVMPRAFTASIVLCRRSEVGRVF
jgi:hypothetical protein